MIKRLIRKIILWACPESVSLNYSISPEEAKSLKVKIEQEIIDIIKRYLR